MEYDQCLRPKSLTNHPHKKLRFSIISQSVICDTNALKISNQSDLAKSLNIAN